MNEYDKIVTIPARKFVARGTSIYLYDKDEKRYDVDSLLQIGASIVTVPDYRQGEEVMTSAGSVGVFIGSSVDELKAVVGFLSDYGTAFYQEWLYGEISRVPTPEEEQQI